MRAGATRHLRAARSKLRPRGSGRRGRAYSAHHGRHQQHNRKRPLHHVIASRAATGKNGPPINAVTMPTGSSPDDQTVRATASQAIRNAAPRKRRGRQHQPVIGPDDQPDEVRHHEPDEPDRARQRHPRPRSRARRRRAASRSAARTLTAACGGGVGAEADEIQRPRQRRPASRRRRARSAARRESARSSRRRASPSASARCETCRRSRGRMVLGEEIQRLEERRHRHAGQQQHDRREAAAARGGQRGRRFPSAPIDPAKLASGIDATPATAKST